MFSLTALLVGALGLLAVLCGLYLFGKTLDWILLRDQLPADLRQSAYSEFLLVVLAKDRQKLASWARKGARTWGRTAWWLAAAMAGAIFIAWWIGGTTYLQSWAASLFRVCSGAAIGFLIARLLLRIDVSEVAAKYQGGSLAQADAAGKALLAAAIVTASAVIAVAVGM